MYSKNPLFDLRGNLNRKTSITLQIAGALIVFVVWWLLSITVSKKNITQIDTFELKSKNLVITDYSYYSNDSLLIADFDKLMEMDDSQLEKFGLKKISVSSLPSPKEVILAIPVLYQKDNLISNVFISIKLNVLGYIIAIFISILIGFIIGLIPLFRGLFNRIFDAGRFIPLTAVTGIFILWLGIGSEMKVSFLAFGILVYLIPVVVQRIDEVQSVYLQTVFTLGASPWQTVKTVYFPYVLSKLIDDIRVLTAISWTYITIVEMLNKSGGIGQLIWEAKRQSAIDKAFAVLLIIILIGILQDKLFASLDKVIFPHKHTQSGEK
ncbi:MAG: ABC transporter permease subunit [Bacteroidota bacterium]|jgi:NitT/TauT family transport system permease protein